MSSVLEERRRRLEQLRNFAKDPKLNEEENDSANKNEANGDSQLSASVVEKSIVNETKIVRDVCDHGVQTEELDVMVDIGSNTEGVRTSISENSIDVIKVGPEPTMIGKSTTLLESENMHLLQKLKTSTDSSMQDIVDQLEFSEFLDNKADYCCIAIDQIKHYILLVFQEVTKPRSNVRSLKDSILFLYDHNSRSVIKHIKFERQELIRGQFLRKNIESKILAAVVTTSNGRIILCEFMQTDDIISDNKTWKHNIVMKSYHRAPVYVIQEIDNATIGDEKFITISVDGVLNKINTITLDQDHEITSQGTNLNQVHIVPPKRGDILKELLNDGFEEEDDGLITDSIPAEKLFIKHLNKVTLFDEIGVTAVVIPPGEDNTMFIGSEDGGIYKLLVDQMDQNKLRVQMDNNGFIPTRDWNIDKKLFHTSHVTSLDILSYSSHDEISRSRFLLSSSLDKSVCVWDVLKNNLLITLSEEHPVLKAQWLHNDNKTFIVVLTWVVCKVYEVNFDYQKNEATLNLYKELPSKDQERFSSFSLTVSKNAKAYIYLGSSSTNITMVEITK